VIVGHSLGASLAVLLSLLLRDKYPNLKCIGYGMPGSVVDRVTAKKCDAFVTAVSLGHDLVTRLNVKNLASLREKVLDNLCRAKVNKTMIMQTLFKDYEKEDFMYNENEMPERVLSCAFRTNVENYKQSVLVTQKAKVEVDLVIPGKIIQLIRKEKGKGSCCSCACSCLCSKEFVPHFAARSAFEEIIVSPTMLTDHFPDRYYNELRKVASTWIKK